MNDFQKLCALRASGKVVRWHCEGFWSGPRQTVSQHTFGMLLILDYICPEEPGLLRTALYHDLAEQAVGDVPAPTKWALGLEGKLDDIEANILSQLTGSVYSTESGFSKQLLYAADLLDHCFVMTEQIAMGNTYFRWLADRIEQTLLEKDPFKYIPKAQEVFTELRRIWAEARDTQQNRLLQDFTNATAWQYLGTKNVP